jgi:hypothetical protein
MAAAARRACDHGERLEQHRKDMPIEKFGGDVLVPNLRSIANCPRRIALGEACWAPLGLER